MVAIEKPGDVSRGSVAIGGARLAIVPLRGMLGKAGASSGEPFSDKPGDFVLILST